MIVHLIILYIAIHWCVRQAAIQNDFIDKDLLEGWAEGKIDDKLASRLVACTLDKENRALVVC